MDLEELDVRKMVGSAAVGGVAALIHHFIAGLVIAPLMWGSLFHGEGGGLAGAIVVDTVVMVAVGPVMGGIGALIALCLKSS